MKHVTFRGLRLRALVLTVVLAAATFVFASPAVAVTTPSAPPASEINTAQPRSDFAGVVTGTVGITGMVGDQVTPAACDDPLATGTCSDHFLTTVNAGLVETRIDWPVAVDPLLESDVDLFVFECRNVVDPVLGAQEICDNLVAVSQQNRGTFEYVTYQADAGDRFRIVVVPAFVFIDQDYTGCNAYVAGAVNCPDPAPQEEPAPTQDAFVQSFCGGPDMTSAKRRQIAGGGKLNNDNDEHFQLDVRERADKNGGQTEGKVQWKDKESSDQRFRGDARGAVFTETTDEGGDKDTEGSARICGFGELQDRSMTGQRTTKQVCFVAQAEDHGEPGATRDRFVIDFYNLVNGSCVKSETRGGQVTEGNINTQFRRV